MVMTMVVLVVMMVNVLHPDCGWDLPSPLEMLTSVSITLGHATCPRSKV